MRKPALAAGLPLDASSVWNGDAVKDAGGTLVAEILKLDDTNEAGQTDAKIAGWVETVKSAM